MDIIVDPSGWLLCGKKQIRCALGRSGVSPSKSEGDGTTPAGRFPLRRVHYRPDRLSAPRTGLPSSPLHRVDGWCDAPDDPSYNKPVRLPYRNSAERLWREDHLYDIVVVIGFNDDPPIPGFGSAIFLHLASEGYGPTEGCVAVALPDAIAILEMLGPTSTISISSAVR